MFNCYMSVDPGLNGTGWAVWAAESNELLKSGNISVRKTENEWNEDAEEIIIRLRHVVKQYAVSKVWIEYPAFFQSAGGEMVARRGDLVKLTWLAGMIHGAMCECRLVEPVPVHMWKGQLPKKVVEKRIKRIIPCLKYTKLKDHVYDAIGIGLYKLGRM